MALDVLRNGIFRPFPIDHGLRVELILTGRRGEAHIRSAIDHHANLLAAFFDGTLVSGSTSAPFSFRRQGFPFMLFVGVLFYFEGTIFTHIPQFRQPFFFGCFRQSRGMLKDILIVLVDIDLFAFSVGEIKCLRIPRLPSGSIRQDSSIQNSSSSQTSPGFTS
jgi:hypothetical protein